nr:MAG TPA: hypothetical protein [Caudoviricetes sp.]
MADEIVKQEGTLATPMDTGMPLGFEDDSAEDLIIPRIKVMQALSPEVQDQKATIGTIINSLTLENITDKVFVPVCKFNNNVLWRDRNAGGGIICRAADGKIGIMEDGTQRYCAQCRKCEFDNTKKGREAIPTCTKYINFLGFFEDDPTPIILSFSKTNMAEGKQMYSMAKVARQNIWNFGYRLTVTKKSNNANSWFIIKPIANGATSNETRALGMDLYRQFAGTMTTVNYDMAEYTTTETTHEIVSDEDSSF